MYKVQKKDLYGNWVDVFIAQKDSDAFQYFDGLKESPNNKRIIQSK